MRRTISALILALAIFTLPSVCIGQADVHALKTAAELSDFEKTSRYEEVMTFLRGIESASDKMHLTSFGYSTEARELPLMIFGDVENASPETVLATGKTRVYLQGNIHAGEVCGKEALLMLLREMAAGDHDEWLQTMVVLVAPIYNVDGNERVSLYNRGRQNGPIAGMGQRPNAQNYDLNRDHLKIDSPEARSLVKFINKYDPHVLVDFHTTNGDYHAYHLTYSPPLHPNTDHRIVDFLKKKWLPEMTTTIKKKHGWDYYYYGNTPRRGSKRERGWYTFDHRPRFSNNYAGLRNRLGILSEAYSYATFKDRILASLYFGTEILHFAHKNGQKIKQLVDEADRTPVVGKMMAVKARHHRAEEEIDLLMGEVTPLKNPYTGRTIYERKDVRTVERMPDYGQFKGTEMVRVPTAYYVPADLRPAVDRLQWHGASIETVAADTTIMVEQFTIDSSRVATREYQGHKAQTLFGSSAVSEVKIAAGTLRIPMDQPLARIIFALLEPRSDDGIVAWGYLTRTLKGKKVYPILRQAGAGK